MDRHGAEIDELAGKRIETGRRGLGIDEAGVIADIFAVPIEYIAGFWRDRQGDPDEAASAYRAQLDQVTTQWAAAAQGRALAEKDRARALAALRTARTYVNPWEVAVSEAEARLRDASDAADALYEARLRLEAVIAALPAES